MQKITKITKILQKLQKITKITKNYKNYKKLQELQKKTFFNNKNFLKRWKMTPSLLSVNTMPCKSIGHHELKIFVQNILTLEGRGCYFDVRYILNFVFYYS